ncbi:MAG: hypothetical protein ACREBC_18230 [Pyrinomonadaceae bacterium]
MNFYQCFALRTSRLIVGGKTNTRKAGFESLKIGTERSLEGLEGSLARSKREVDGGLKVLGLFTTLRTVAKDCENDHYYYRHENNYDGNLHHSQQEADKRNKLAE